MVSLKISKADRARIRLAAVVDKASLAMIKESLKDGVHQAVTDHINDATSRGMKIAATECSTHVVDEMKTFFAAEKVEVKKLIASEKAEIRSLFGSE